MNGRPIKYCLGTLLALLIMQTGHTQSRFEYDYPAGDTELNQNNRVKQSLKMYESIELLQSAKFFIINGELEKAKILLKEATLTSDFSKKTQLRYLAIIHFIEGNYKLAEDIFKRNDMQEYTSKSRYCAMEVLNLLIIGKLPQARQQYKDCREVILPKAENNLLWFDTLVALKTTSEKTNPDDIFNGVFIENLSGDNLRIYLKLALYLNKQNSIIPRFKYFSANTLSDPLFRELIGMNYFRNIDLVKAYQLLENSSDLNAEVFKGNILLLQEKYAAAYAQFKLALLKKYNSVNAIERLIPLSWKLDQFNEGISFIKQHKINKNKNFEKLSIKAAFLIMDNKKKDLDKTLRQIEKLTRKGNPIEVNQFKTLNAIYGKNNIDLEENTYKACLKNDGLHCWLLLNLHHFDEAAELFSIPRPLHPKKLNSLESLFEKQEKKPLSEEVFVNQQDVEELDNELIDLIDTSNSNAI